MNSNEYRTEIFLVMIAFLTGLILGLMVDLEPAETPVETVAEIPAIPTKTEETQIRTEEAHGAAKKKESLRD